jgi:hypothetical protein
LGKATIKSVVFVCPFVHMEQVDYHWMDFNWTWYSCAFQKSAQKIQVSLQRDKNNAHSARRSVYRKFMTILWILLRMQNVLGQKL